MTLYVHKPAVVEAYEFNGCELAIAGPDWIVEAINSGTITLHRESLAVVDPDRCVARVFPGDFVVRAGAGKRYHKGWAKEEFLALYVARPDLKAGDALMFKFDGF